jgi:hypothetical protein
MNDQGNRCEGDCFEICTLFKPSQKIRIENYKTNSWWQIALVTNEYNEKQSITRWMLFGAWPYRYIYE